MNTKSSLRISRQRPDKPPQIVVGDPVLVSCGIKEMRGRVIDIRPGQRVLDTRYYVRLASGEARWFGKARVSYYPTHRLISRGMQLIRESHFDSELRANLGLPQCKGAAGIWDDQPSYFASEEFDSELE